MAQARVLVADDDPAVCTLLKALLRRSAFSCDIVSDGDAALRRLRTSEYDAVLLDLMMPGTWGIDVIRSLQVERPEMVKRVIVITAASTAALRNFDSEPVYALVRKPFDIDELIDTVRTCSSSTADPQPDHSLASA